METQIPNNSNKDIPGNPSTSKSSHVVLRSSANESSLRVLSMDDWSFGSIMDMWLLKMQFLNHKQKNS